MSYRCLGCMEVMKEGFDVCPHCGFIRGTHVGEVIHMEPGTILHDRYLIGKVLGFGGFGVTYIGWDQRLEQKVAIKEYMPSEFSTRMPGQTQVTVFEGEKREQYGDGLQKFVEEAKRLAKFQNEPGIVKIFDSFEENGTAYIIMEYLEGETLTDYMRREGNIPEDKAIEMLLPLMNSLKNVHAEGILHRDIAPDNIFITKAGEVKLIDFGASRYATTSHSRSLTVIIKPGYSPEEQYRSRGDQGPYTDVYALAATLYKMVTGQTPPDAMERRAKYENQNKDILQPPHKYAKGISATREIAILNAMNVRIEDRTADIDSFMGELFAEKPAKRVYGRIKKIDLYLWPLWVKILLPVAGALLLTLGVLIATGVINFSHYTNKMIIPNTIALAPDVEGMTKDSALGSIESSGLLASIAESIESDYIPAGKILIQTPVGGSFCEKNTPVVLVISIGKDVERAEGNIATVPYLIGTTVETAKERLNTAELGEPEISWVNDENVDYGLVIETSEEAGTKLEKGTTITLKVSLGPAAFAMPLVAGKSAEEAITVLDNVKLVAAFEYAKDDNVPEGYVISQSIEENAEVKRGDRVTLVISSGANTYPVANVVGMTKADADATLKEQGFVVNIVENTNEEVPAGIVISQTPEANTSQVKGVQVTIFVSLGKKEIKVSFDSNFDGVTSTKTVHMGETYGELPNVSRNGYTFAGWFTEANGGTEINSSTPIISSVDHTIYAHWNKKADPTPTPRPTSTPTPRPTSTPTPLPTNTPTPTNAPTQVPSFSVAFDPNGGTASAQSITVTYGQPYGTLPAAERQGYTFAGWFTDGNGGTQVDASTGVTANTSHTLYAHWVANQYTVSFDGNGGSTTGTSLIATYDSQYGTLPSASLANSDFLGWFTEKSGGTQITSDTVFKSASDITLYAHWQAWVYIDLNGTINGKSETGLTNAAVADIYINDVLNASAVTDYYACWPVGTRFKVVVRANDYYSLASESVIEGTVGTEKVTISPKVNENPVEGWVLSSRVPSGAKIVERKWKYTRTQTKESKNTSESGWTQTGSYWKQTGTGSTYYASFPGGFDTNNYYYKNFAKAAYSSSESATNKRTVTNSRAGYIYWHWAYNAAYYNVLERWISDRNQTAGSSRGLANFAYVYFYAFASSVNAPQISGFNYTWGANGQQDTSYVTYNCSNCLPGGADTSATSGLNNPRFLRFDYYQSTYTDYEKIFQYKKTTSEESSTKVTAGGEISDVQEYVRYIKK